MIPNSLSMELVRLCEAFRSHLDHPPIATTEKTAAEVGAGDDLRRLWRDAYLQVIGPLVVITHSNRYATTEVVLDATRIADASVDAYKRACGGRP